MRFINIYKAKDAWVIVIKLGLPPLFMNRLRKYAKKVFEELEVIEGQRNDLVMKYSTAKEGEQPSVAANTPEIIKYNEEFSELLAGEVELKPFDITVDEFIEIVAKDKANVLSIEVVELLEPFFSVVDEKS
jgi:hypothetical protein